MHGIGQILHFAGRSANTEGQLLVCVIGNHLKSMDEYGVYRDLDLLKIAALSIERVEFLSGSCSS